MYHYFVEVVNTRDLIIVESENGKITTPGWTLFTNEQEAFYAKHPDYDIWNIQNCEEIYIPTLEEYKSIKTDDITNYSDSLLENNFTFKEISNMLISKIISDDGGKTIYNKKQITSLGNKYVNYYFASKDILGDFNKKLETCKTNSDVDKLYQESTNNLDELYKK